MRILGTPLVCDAPRTAGALAFLSNAAVVGARRGTRSPVTAAQVLLTPVCNSLLEAAGHALGSRGLVTAYGRPFAFGLLRVELFPSGVAPGAASLSCEGPKGRVVFAGPVGLGEPGSETLAAEIRPAEALCVDATHAAQDTPFAPVSIALNEALRFVTEALAERRQPVLLTGLESLTLQLARKLEAASLTVRAPTALLQLAEVHTKAGLPATTLKPFSGTLGPAEVLLLPAQGKISATLGRLKAPQVAITAGVPLPPGEVAKLAPKMIIPLGNLATRNDLLAYIRATGAKEIATLNDGQGVFAEHLRRLGFDAYSLGPPAQMTLFAV